MQEKRSNLKYFGMLASRSRNTRKLQSLQALLSYDIKYYDIIACFSFACVPLLASHPYPPEKYKKNAQNTKKPNAELYFLSHRLNESILLVISQKLSFLIFVWKKFLFSLFFGKLSIWFALFHNFCKFACVLYSIHKISEWIVNIEQNRPELLSFGQSVSELNFHCSWKEWVR